MALFLQWGGSYPETKSMDMLFFQSLNPSKKLLYIPTAMVGGYSYAECYEYISYIIQELWITINIESYPYLDTLSSITTDEYSGIYIWGGNTFKLLYEIKKNKLEQKLIQFLENGWNICGGSAGAIIFGKNINTAPDANIIGLTEVEGLDVLQQMSVWCHHQQKNEKEIEEYVKHYQIPVIALPETAGLKVGPEIQIIGEENIILYTTLGKRIYQQGEKIA